MKRMKIRTVAMSLLVALLLCAVPAFAEAGETRMVPLNLWVGSPSFSIIDFENLPEDAEVISVKSSKPGIISAEIVNVEGLSNSVQLRAHNKPGKAKITVKYTTQGKTCSVSQIHHVRKYPNPFKSLLVNGKAVNCGKNHYDVSFYGFKKTSATVKFKLAKGWKVLSLGGGTQIDGDYSTYRRINIKNGKAFRVPKGRDANVFIWLQNARKDNFIYQVSINRGKASAKK